MVFFYLVLVICSHRVCGAMVLQPTIHQTESTCKYFSAWLLNVFHIGIPFFIIQKFSKCIVVKFQIVFYNMHHFEKLISRKTGKVQRYQINIALNCYINISRFTCYTCFKYEGLVVKTYIICSYMQLYFFHHR